MAPRGHAMIGTSRTVASDAVVALRLHDRARAGRPPRLRSAAGRPRAAHLRLRRARRLQVVLREREERVPAAHRLPPRRAEHGRRAGSRARARASRAASTSATVRWPARGTDADAVAPFAAGLRARPRSPLLSFIVPAHDEAATIAAVVDAIRARRRRARARNHRRRRRLDRRHRPRSPPRPARGCCASRIATSRPRATRAHARRAATCWCSSMPTPDRRRRGRRPRARARRGRGRRRRAACASTSRCRAGCTSSLPAMLALFRWLRFTGGCFVFARAPTSKPWADSTRRSTRPRSSRCAARSRRRGRFAILRETVLTSGRKLRTLQRARDRVDSAARRVRGPRGRARPQPPRPLVRAAARGPGRAQR